MISVSRMLLAAAIFDSPRPINRPALRPRSKFSISSQDGVYAGHGRLGSFPTHRGIRVIPLTQTGKQLYKGGAWLRETPALHRSEATMPRGASRVKGAQYRHNTRCC